MADTAASASPSSGSSAYGSWPSPLSARIVAGGATGLGGLAIRSLENAQAATGSSPAGGSFEPWWLELRAEEKGRAVLVRRLPDGSTVDVIPAPYSARTRVHEYGGGAWWLGRADAYFANWEDQRLYRIGLPSNGEDEAGAGTTGDPMPLTPEPTVAAGWRYADGAEHPDGDWLVCVRENHHGIGAENGPAEAVNELVAIPTSGDGPVGADEVTVVAGGADFLAGPRFSPDGRWLSWIRWNHPNMPWDGTELCAAPVFANRRIGNVQVVAGGTGTEAIHGADWHSDGRLLFSSDRNGWWNLQVWTPADGLDPEPLTGLEGAEIGGPQWVFGTQAWTELADGRIAASITTDAVDAVAVIDEGGQPATVLPVGRDLVVAAGLVGAPDGRLGLLLGTPTGPPSISLLDPADGSLTDLRPADDPGVDPAWFSRARPVSFPSGDRTAHAFFYPPSGPDLAGPAGSAPPLIVMGHGGPTAHAAAALNLKIQYWTSRGFAVVDVNYGGSSGFGRAYRDLLQRSWGIVDVEDCIAAARHLAAEGLVDGDRLAIRGGSAGGFTVLAALVESDVFSAGTSLYGVADLTALAADTHKFESRYLDGLIGPYPERRDLYEERSPINHTDRFETPLLVLQGLEDEIVPPNQSEAIVAALAAKGIPHAYVPFEGEQHGFRQADNIVRSLEVELWFYGRVFGFEPADPIDAPDGAVGLDPAT